MSFPSIPLSVMIWTESNIEAKDNKHSVGSGMPQALAYGEILDVPFTHNFSRRGDIYPDTGGRCRDNQKIREFSAFNWKSDSIEKVDKTIHRFFIASSCSHLKNIGMSIAAKIPMPVMINIAIINQ